VHTLPQEVIRCEATTVSGAHAVTAEGLLQFGYSNVKSDFCAPRGHPRVQKDSLVKAIVMCCSIPRGHESAVAQTTAYLLQLQALDERALESFYGRFPALPVVSLGWGDHGVRGAVVS
jgi:hypothetical protein